MRISSKHVQGDGSNPRDTAAGRKPAGAKIPGKVRPHALGDDSFLPQSADEVLATFDKMSRKIKDLARELNCLGYFDDDNSGRPRAA